MVAGGASGIGVVVAAGAGGAIGETSSLRPRGTFEVDAVMGAELPEPTRPPSLGTATVPVATSPVLLMK